MSLLRRFVSVFRKRRLEDDLEDELRSHLQMRIQDNVDAGMPEAEARLDALRRFGNTALIKENTRSTRIMVSLESLFQDVRFGLRTLRRSPGFTVVALLTIAFSIAVSTAVFTMVNAVLLRPLPYQQPDKLASFEFSIPALSGFSALPSRDLVAWREQATNTEAIAGFSEAPFTLTGRGDPSRLMAAQVSSSFLPMLGVTPEMGRTFAPEEDQPNGDLVTLITHRLWQERFGADPQVVGQRISLDEARYTIIGVLPAEFRFPSQLEPDLLVPLQISSLLANQSPPGKPKPDFTLLDGAIARLKPGVSLKTAAAELEGISAQVYRQYSVGYQNFMKERKVEAVPLREALVGNVQRPLLIMLAAVGLVLIIGCFNIASMQLARAIQRSGELSVRAALGARQGRLLRQLVTENVLLSCAGALPGILLAAIVIWMFRASAARVLPHIANLNMDWRVLGFALLAALGSGLFFGLLPAIWTNRRDINHEAIKGRRSTISRGQRRFCNALVIGELALSVVLMAAAGLLVRSYVRLTSEDLGFNYHNVLTARVELAKRYPTPQRQQVFVQQVLEQLQASPGVESAAICNSLPLAPWLFTSSIHPENRLETPGNAAPTAYIQGVSADYFRTFQIPLIKGRTFNDADKWDSDRVAVVNQSFAQMLFPGEEVIGKRFHAAPRMDTWITIVGLVADNRHVGLGHKVNAEVYTPFQQPVLSSLSTAIAIRSRSDASELTALLRRVLGRLDSNQAIYDVATMEERLAATLAERKLQMLVLVCFATMAMALGIVGVYGVLSYSVAQRSHEIGVRMALGSNQSRVLKFVLSQAVVLALVGVGIGVAGALGLTRFMSSLLYSVQPFDPPTMVIVSMLLMVVSALAGYIPARRASRVDPMIVLRHE